MQLPFIEYHQIMLDPITESLENWAIPERRNVGPYMLTLQNQYLNENILQGGAGKSGKCTFCVKFMVLSMQIPKVREFYFIERT